jgi:hypothetical protein
VGGEQFAEERQRIECSSTAAFARCGINIRGIRELGFPRHSSLLSDGGQNAPTAFAVLVG